MNLMLPTSRSRTSSSQTGLPRSLGGLIVCAACSAAGAEAGKQVGEVAGRVSIRLLRKQLLDVQRRVRAYGERLVAWADAGQADAGQADAGQTDAAPEDRSGRGDGFGSFLTGVVKLLAGYIGKELGKAAAEDLLGAAWKLAGEVGGAIGGLGLGIAIVTTMEGDTPKPSPPGPDPAPAPPPAPQPAGEPLPPGLAENGHDKPTDEVGDPFAGEGDPFGDEGGCFIPGTLVSTVRGLVPIQQIRVGDIVAAWNAVTGVPENRPVLRTSVAEGHSLTSLRFGRHSVSCTPLHRFFTGTWTPAKDLQTGDRVLRLSGGWSKVKSRSTAPQTTPVHNISVEGLRNYAVGRLGLIVHNDKESVSV
jgi:hypothetical protein